ncbi:MAG: efflux RND transporter permease subunit [Armatimonadetes bacterium]|nr:efflux RND transporter permease subunit [Armatimonadota bacterium]
MHTLARICVQRPVFATVLSLTLLVVGIAGYLGLGVDRHPNVEFPFVIVSTIYPGAAPEEVETEITDPIEQQVNTIGGIDGLNSTSSDGMSLVSIRFDLNKDADVAAEEVRAKVALAKAELPPDAEDPVVLKLDMGATPVISYAISANRPVREVYEYVDKKLRRRVETVAGVGEVQVIGGRERQINIVLDPYRMRAHGVTVSDITKALSEQNAQIPGGVVEQGPQQLTLRTQGRLESVEAFGAVPVESLGGREIYIRDLARVEDSESRLTSIASINGNETVVLQVVKQSGANAISVIESTKERIAEVSKELPRGYRVDLVQDQSTYIEASLHAVREHLLLGALLAALVVFLFLGNMRSTLIAALAIPTSVITTFAVMRMLGFTQNVVTLLALTLSVGIVIDDAIVVLENIFRVIEEHALSPREAAIRATKEIGLAVVAITLALIAVFLPVAFMGSIVGRFLNSFGLTMAAAIAVSMFISFSLTPMLASRWLQPPAEDGPQSHHEAESKSGWFRVLDLAYARMLEWSLRHKWVVVLASVMVFFSIVPLAGMARKNFLPDDDEAQFQVRVRAPEGTSIEGTRSICEALAAEVQKMPEVKLVLVTIAGDQQRTTNLGTVFVRMNEVEDREDRAITQYTHMARVRKDVLPKFEGRGLRLSVQKTSNFGGSSNAAIQMMVSGPDLRKLAELSDEAVRRARRIPGVADVDTSLVTGKPELQAVVDREQAASLGVKVSEVARALRLAVGGDDKITDFEEDGEQYEVHVRLEEQYRQDARGIELLEVPSNLPGGSGNIGLDQVVTFVRTSAPSSIERYNRQRTFTLMVNILPGASQAAVTAEVNKILADLKMPPGYAINATGQSKEFSKMGRNFLMAFTLSGIFMYLVIAAQFESFIHAIAIMVTLPLTMPFAILSIILTGDSMNIFSLLGMLVLLGVVKKNAILQIDRANQLRLEGMSLHDATVQASRDRLRPILMTTIAFVAGMLPLVFATGIGSPVTSDSSIALFPSSTRPSTGTLSPARIRRRSPAPT